MFVNLILVVCCLLLFWCYVSRQQAICRQENAIRQVIDVVPDILVFIKDPKGNFIYVNQAMCEHFGKTEKDFLQSSPFLLEEDNSVLQNGTVEQDFKAINGRFFSTVKVPLKDHRGEVQGIAFIWKDVSNLKIEQAKYSYILSLAMTNPSICPQA